MICKESVSLEDIATKRQLQTAGKTLWRNLTGALLRIVGAAAICALSAALIDRPVSTWMHEHLGYQRYGWFVANFHGHLLKFGPFSLMAGPSEALRPLSVLAFAVLAIAAYAGWRPRIYGRIAVALCLSVFASLAIASFAKEAFGRTWPESWLGDNPSWIRDGVYGFFPFHGGDGWGSFPSGHTSVVATTATILWLVWPKLRFAWTAIVAIVVVGLIGGNYHFVSDVVGGLFLGVAIGSGIAAMIFRPQDQVTVARRPLSSQDAGVPGDHAVCEIEPSGT
jgi:membrane-associated phospholipid phosphatase